MKGKICVLAIDALDYKLVKMFLLKNYMQEEYGKVKLPLKKDEIPRTPIMWTSFFTGKTPGELGLTELEEVRKSFGIRWKIQKILKKLGLKKIILEMLSGLDIEIKSDHDFVTLFDKIPNSKSISMPNYNEDLTNFLIRNRIVDVIDGDYSQERFDRLIMRAFRRKRNKLLKSLDEDLDLIVVHIFLLDAVCHAFFRHPKKIKHYYSVVSDFVKGVSEKLDEDDLLLVISDHGCRKGEHTSYAFYSLNKKLGLKDPKLTDFYQFVLDQHKE